MIFVLCVRTHYSSVISTRKGKVLTKVTIFKTLICAEFNGSLLLSGTIIMGAATTERIMSDRKQLERLTWREPTDEEKDRLAYAGRRNKATSFVLLGVVILLIALPLIRIKDVISMFQTNLVGFVIAAVLFAGLILFLILRIHLTTKYKVADVIVDEIVLNSSTDNGNYCTATVSQGDVVLTGVTIAMKEHPEAGTAVLLYMENNDTWTVGIV